MVFVLVIFIIVCLHGIKIADNEDYLSKNQSDAIKGIMAFLIYCSHIRQYITLEGGFLDQSYGVILNALGQLPVGLFFFYSGYGILISYTKKNNYYNTFFCSRFLKTLCHFDMAVLCFVIINIFIGNKYSSFEYYLSWIGWTSIGNSNWYMFNMFVVYLIALVSMFMAEAYKNKEEHMVIFTRFVSVLTLAFASIMFLIKGTDSRWYTTVLCFPTGCVYGLNKNKIDDILREKKKRVLSIVISLFVFCLLYYLKHMTRSNIPFSVMSCVFSCLLIFVLKEVMISNRVLQFLGKHSFSFYILQRIPMIVLSSYGLVGNRYIFFAVCLTITVLMSMGFDYCCNAFDKRFLSINNRVIES